MSEDTKPKDGTEGTPEGGDGGSKEKPEAGKVFTQEELDAILADRLKRAVPKDYEALKEKAEKFDQAEQAKKDEATREREARQEADRKAAEREAKANAKLKRAAILEEASKQNAANTAAVVRMLESDDTIEVNDDGEVAGVETAVKKLLKEIPELVKKTGARGEFGGTDGKPVADRIRELEQKGDRESLAEARRLKIEGMAGGT